MAHFWDVYQGEKWIGEVTADSPSKAVQKAFSEHGLESTEGMRAVEFDPDVNDPNVRWTPYRNQEKPDSYLFAVIRLVESVETSDEPEHRHLGPDYDVYEVTVVSGPENAFLLWFEQDNEYDLCRVGDTRQFLCLGGLLDPVDGEVIALTYDEFFPLWLDASVRIAKADIHRMADEAISNIGLT